MIDDPEDPTGTDNGTAAYWRASCGITEDGKQTSPDTVTYIRSVEPPYAPNQEREAFRVCTSAIAGASADYANPLLRRIWKDFLYPAAPLDERPGRRPARHKGPGGRPRYGIPLRGDRGGWMREWYVYVPEQVKAQPEKPVPLVFAMHGYTCAGENRRGPFRSGTRLRISMALLWCILRQRRDRC